MRFLNDVGINKFIGVVLGVQLAMLGLLGLACLGLDAPILRQVVGFIFLTFVPGVLILRILKIHNIGVIESLVYSVGLSLAFVMFGGMLINFTLPLIGVSRPISLIPVTLTLVIFTMVLTAIAYVRNRTFTVSKETVLGEKLPLLSVLLLALLLLLVILGVAITDYYQNNVLLLILTLAIAGVIGLAAFGKLIEPRIYLLAIFIIGLCLLYQTTLMSPSLVGSDIHQEYYFHRLVVENGFWDASIPRTINSCLSITILAPVYSLLLNIDGIWMFKAIYPLLFSLAPLTLFHIFSQQMSYKKALLATFFFVAVPTFSLEMISSCRQQVAELFFVLLILLMVDRKLNLFPRLTLVIIFAASIVVSHYGLGFIGFIYIGLFLPLLFIIRSSIFRKAWGWLTRKFGGLPRSLIVPRALPGKMLVIVVVMYFAAGFAWYGAVSSGTDLNLLSRIWRGQIGTITSEISKVWSETPELTSETPEVTPEVTPETPEVTPETPEPLAFFRFGERASLVRTALGLDFPRASPMGKGFRILQYITQLFLIIGCFRLLFRPRNLRFTAEYIALSVTSVLLILACIFLPVFASLLNTTRMYHITLILLAPFCILGGEAIWLGVSSLWQKLRRRIEALEFAEDSQGYFKFVTLAVLIPYFLFTSGFIFEVTKNETTDVINEPYSIALSSHRVDLAGVCYWQDVASADWLAQNIGDESIILADSGGYLLLSERTELAGRITASFDMTKLPENSYIYFRAWNIEKQGVTGCAGIGLRRHVVFDDIPGMTEVINSKNRVYNNGGAQILAPK
jgi:uncharacterized membrane protein